MKGRDVAIMTYWGYNDNYGQILQAYALSTYLKNQGHNVKLIKYDHMHDMTTRLSTSRRIKSYIDRPHQFLKGLISRIQHIFSKPNFSKCPCEKSFIEFKENNLSWTELYPTFNDLKSNPPVADCYICGSDMIWAESAFKPDPFYLGFGNPDKKVAYAPSFGRKFISKTFQKEISPLLKQFDNVSVREPSGVEICKKAGCPDAVHVPDPTLLLNEEDYQKIEEKIETPDNYIFAYILGEDSKFYLPKILEISKSSNIPLVYRNAQGGNDLYPQTFMSPGQWLYLIKNAKHIYTNSFHGVIFSIIYKKPFTFLPLKGKSASSNERIDSILSLLELSDQIYNGEMSFESKGEIYTPEKLKKLEGFISTGQNFLKENLS